MVNVRLYIIIVVLVLAFPLLIRGQEDSLNTRISITDVSKLETRKDYLNYISEKYGFIFSYNAQILDINVKAGSTSKHNSLINILGQVFYPDKIKLTYIPPNKIVLSKTVVEKSNNYLLSGVVKDADSGEAIYGAVILERNSGISTITNEKGYFVMKLIKGRYDLEVHFLGYKKSVQSGSPDKNTFIQIPMAGSYFLDTVYVLNPSRHLQLADGGNLLEVVKLRGYQSISGESDIVNNARILPGVTSGGEGLSGLYVRGGTPDQNLTMLDGVVMYESSHLLGITSTFMEESIKEASFIKNGFPARYGGRLSSVLDIRLKEGDLTKNNTSISAGFSGMKLHLDGPILKNKLTYSLSARGSWLNYYINSLLRKYTKYDDIYLKYHDLLGKVTYHFTPFNSLSLSIYNGSDRFNLIKSSTLINEEDDYTLKVYDKNGIGWSNQIASLKWNYLLGDKLSLKVQSGYIKYSNNARSSYIFENILQDTTRIDRLDVLSQTNIIDYNIRLDLDYYLNEHHVIRAGFNALKQSFNPTVKQSTIILDDEAAKITDKDSTIFTNQLQIYIEDNFKWQDKLYLYGGIHAGNFKTGSKWYTSIQPRLKAVWMISDRHMLSASYSKMTQFVHLLTNSGLGLPSNLWVPSTEKIKPQDSDQWSANYTFNILNTAYIQLGGYTRKMYNVLEYTTPIDMFYFLINDQNITTVFNTARDWERHVYAGSGTSRGLEFLANKNSGKWTGWASVTRSETFRYFNDINNGKPFPASYDKPWDVNLGLYVNLSESWNLGANFVYNTGNAFSLATEEYDSYLGIKLLNNDGKNNYRLPDFHQLSLSAMYHHKGKKFDTNISLKLYNVYNRLNAYYIYIYKNELTPNVPLFRKVSILPFTPSLSATLVF